MLGSTFYYKSIRNATIAFGQLFSNITIDRENRAGETIKTLKIPLLYSEKENFVTILINDKVDNEDPDIQLTLPRMGYAIRDIAYDSSRKLNTMDKLATKDTEKFSFNRVPYNVDFELLIGTRRIDDGYRIIEQILPYFTPELNVRVKEKMDSEIISNLPYVLTGVSQDTIINTMDERRNIMWTLNFTCKLNLYTSQRDLGTIRRSIIDINSSTSQALLEQYMSTVDPINAGINDDWTVDESITRGDFNTGVFTAFEGTTMEFDFDMYEIYQGSHMIVDFIGYPQFDGGALAGSELTVELNG